MDDFLTRYRRAKRGAHGRTWAAPAMRALREEAIAYVARRRRAGATRRAIAGELGASDATVRRYLRAAAATTKLREVAVVARATTAALVLVAPSGHRVEGLDVDAAIALLRGLV